MAQALNTSTKAASESTGVPNSTIRYWLDDPQFAYLRYETHEHVAEQFWAVIQVGLKEVAKGLVDPDTALRDKSVALGILYDKHALLTGGATARNESRDVTHTLSDPDLIAAVREAERLIGTSPARASATAEGPTEG